MTDEYVNPTVRADSDGVIDDPREDTWQSLCDAGRFWVESLDRDRYKIGEIALRVERKYGENSLGKWANEIGLSRSAVDDYAKFVRYYQNPAYAEIVADKNLSYSQLREVARLDLTPEQGVAILTEASQGDWSVERTGVAARKLIQPDALIWAKKGVFEGDVSLALQFVSDILAGLVASKKAKIVVYAESEE